MKSWLQVLIVIAVAAFVSANDIWEDANLDTVSIVEGSFDLFVPIVNSGQLDWLVA